MLEVEVHQQLRAFLRACGDRPWLHHLTLARLVARVLRSGRSSLIQGGTAVAAGRHRLSYLAPALLCEQAVVLVVPPAVQQRLLEVDLARLRLWLAQSDRPLPPVHCLVDQPPEAAQALAAHRGCWQLFLRRQRARGHAPITVTPEFGPDGYLPLLPFTAVPVADLLEINSAMARWIRQGALEDALAEEEEEEEEEAPGALSR